MASAAPAADRITAMSRNLYIGTDVDVVIRALATPDPSDDLPALLAGIAELQQTSFPHRVAALADEIARHRPHVIGLQEVSIVDIDLTPFGIPIDFDLDYLPLLQASLAARGLSYVVAATVTGITGALPGVTIVDRDVLLVDAARVSFDPASVVSQTFAANLGMVAPGIVLLRGWVALDATIGGRVVKIASTHLESGNQPGFSTLRALQAAELLGSLGVASPAILLGDLNDPPGSPMYELITGSGFVDAWAALRPGVAGLTCCHAPDLSNPVAVKELDQRIDFILSRGIGHTNEKLLGRIDLLGTTPGDRVAGPLYAIWPSDHAGLVADLLTPDAR